MEDRKSTPSVPHPGCLAFRSVKQTQQQSKILQQMRQKKPQYFSFDMIICEALQFYIFHFQLFYEKPSFYTSYLPTLPENFSKSNVCENLLIGKSILQNFPLNIFDLCFSPVNFDIRNVWIKYLNCLDKWDIVLKQPYYSGLLDFSSLIRKLNWYITTSCSEMKISSQMQLQKHLAVWNVLT